MKNALRLLELAAKVFSSEACEQGPLLELVTVDDRPKLALRLFRSDIDGWQHVYIDEDDLERPAEDIWDDILELMGKAIEEERSRRE